MEKGLFFNAFPNEEYETGYDRNYSADDISDWLKAVITTGVIKTNNVSGTGAPLGLKVVADSGLDIKVNVGMAVIDGKPYVNNSSLSLTLATAPTSGTRYDCVVLRMNNTQVLNARKTYCLVSSLDHIPTEADLTRTDNIYDLLLGYVAVGANVTSIQQTNITDTRGDETLCPWTTAIKGYEDYYDAIVQRFESDITLQSAGSVAVTDLAVSLYNDKYSLISVYCNGLREDEGDYSVDTSNEYITINFTATKSAGAQINVILENFIDGEGFENVLDQYNALVQEVANLNKLNDFNYYCNGVDDNVEISDFVNELIDDANENETIKINVIGTFGMSAPANGSGTSGSPYKIFAFDNNTKNVRFSLDFTHCRDMEIAVNNGSVTIIFDGYYGQVVGATIKVENTASNTIVRAFGEQYWSVVNSRFYLTCYKSSVLGYYGEFINCEAIIQNQDNNSYVFYPRSNGLLKVRGGEYRSYVATSSGAVSAVFGLRNDCYVFLENVNCPNYARSGYTQTYAIFHDSGNLTCVGLVTSLTVNASASAVITGTITGNFADQVW